MPSSIWDAAPTSGFLYDYLNYALQMTDPPPVYHVGAAIATLSATVARKAMLEIDFHDGTTAVQPLHMWIMLLGQSGDRKSTACTRVLELAKDYTTEQGPTGGSPEAFYQWISLNPGGYFFFTEMASLFGLQQASYWQQGATFWNQLYDGDDFKRSLMGQEKGKKGKKLLNIEIEAPRVTLLGCATPSLLDATTRETDWTGGLIGRMLPFYAARDTLKHWANRKNPVNEAKLAAQLGDLRIAIQNNIVVGVTAAARAEYEIWQTDVDERRGQFPERMQAIVNRLPIHVLRVAGLYALSTMSSDVDRDLMMRAINLGDMALDTVTQLGKMLTTDRIARLVKTVRTLLQNSPDRTMTKRDLMENLSISWKNLEPVLKSMAEGNELEYYSDGTFAWVRLVNRPLLATLTAEAESYVEE